MHYQGSNASNIVLLRYSPCYCRPKYVLSFFLNVSKVPSFLMSGDSRYCVFQRQGTAKLKACSLNEVQCTAS